jgi:hypothetical protein
MYEIVTLFANYGVLRTNLINFNFSANISGKSTPKFFGMARHCGSAYLGMLVISKAIPAGNRQRHDKFSFSLHAAAVQNYLKSI